MIPRWKIISLSVGVFLFLLTCKTKSSDTDTTNYLNHHDSVDYVGIQACRPCHSDKYDSFVHTGMGQSFFHATKEKSVANFEGIEAVYDSKTDLYYFPFWNKDSLYFREFRLKNGDTTHSLVKKIDYIIGSGQHTNSHLYTENGYLYQAPLTWYSQKQKWDLPPGFENENSRFSRKLDVECVSCHNAMPVYTPNSGNRFEHIPLGIDCERCHGPGEAHINKIKSGDITDTSTSIDYSIVNPAKLSWQLQMDVCQRCHLQGNAVLKSGKRFIDFRPGMKLTDYFEVFLPEYEGDHSFIMASHAERLSESQCFIQSNNESNDKNVTCISCHNPHISVNSTPKEKFNNACKSCHTQESCTETEEQLKLNAYNCVSCHMPKTSASDIPHVAIHDHKISIPGNEESPSEEGVLIGLKSINNYNTSDLTLLRAYISKYEKSGNNPFFIHEAEKLLDAGNAEVKIHYFYNTEQYSEIIELASTLIPKECDDPWTLMRIARSYMHNEQWSSSEFWLDSLASLAPFNLDFNNERAIVKMRLKKLDDAVSILNILYELQPNYETTLVNLGRVYFLKDNLGLAKKHSLKAILLNPDSKDAISTLRDIYLATGDLKSLEKITKKLNDLSAN
jgi:hypothetical protein